MSTLKYALALSLCPIIFGACQPKVDSQSTGKYLYAVSGGCYAGSATVTTAARTIVRFNLDTGVVDRTVVDYHSTAGDTPVAAVNVDSDYINVLVENTGGRRIEKVKKSTGDRSVLATFPTGTWNTVVRDLIQLKSGAYLIPRTAAMEKYSSSFVRTYSNSTNPWMNGPGGVCATSTGMVSRALELSNGKVLFSNGLTNQNRVGLIPATMATQSDCLAAQNSPIIASTFPTAMAYIPSAGGTGVGHLLVAYASATATNSSNLISQYTVDETANTITPSAATNAAAFADTSIINGPTAMYYDSDSGYVYVANGSTNIPNSIEKFTYSASTKTLTHVGSAPFAVETANSLCINSMFIAD